MRFLRTIARPMGITDQSGSRGAFLSAQDPGSTDRTDSTGMWIITLIIGMVIMARCQRVANGPGITGRSSMVRRCMTNTGTRLLTAIDEP
jgi:hypothetical protein